MKRGSLLVLVPLLVMAAVISQAQDKSGDETIKVETKLVSVPVIVSDRNGRYIPNLIIENFKLFQDGAEQKIEFFAASEEPINVALLIDTSQSTRPVLDDIKESARAFLKLLKPRDQAMVLAFDHDTHLLAPLTSDQGKLKDAISKAEIPPSRLVGTVMRDALLRTVDAFRDLTGRKAIILLTDGKDMNSRTTAPDLIHRMQESDTLIYSVMFQTGVIPQRVIERINRTIARHGVSDRDGTLPAFGKRMLYENDRAAEYLQRLSDITAGRFYSSKDGKIKETFGAIVEELRFQYRLGYYPPEEKSATGTVHEIRVKVSRQDSIVRARSRYRVAN